MQQRALGIRRGDGETYPPATESKARLEARRRGASVYELVELIAEALRVAVEDRAEVMSAQVREVHRRGPLEPPDGWWWWTAATGKLPGDLRPIVGIGQ